jgi:putative tryptophan/tyrosine transport system substrate-binding protein
MAVELTSKRLQLLKHAVGDLSRVALLVNATDTEGARRYVDAARVVADPLGISVLPVGVSTPHEFERAFSEMREKRLQAVVLGQDGLFFSDLASAERLCQLASY